MIFIHPLNILQQFNSRSKPRHLRHPQQGKISLNSKANAVWPSSSFGEYFKERIFPNRSISLKEYVIKRLIFQRLSMIDAKSKNTVVVEHDSVRDCRKNSSWFCLVVSSFFPLQLSSPLPNAIFTDVNLNRRECVLTKKQS